jgi:hypothetical protein
MVGQGVVNLLTHAAHLSLPLRSGLLGTVGGKDFRFTYPDGNRVEYNVLVFGCTVVGGTLSPRDGSLWSCAFSTDRTAKLALPYPDALLMPDAPHTLFQWNPEPGS